MSRSLFLIALGLWLDGALAAAASLSIPAARDNTMFSESDHSGGQATTLLAGQNNQAGVRRGLIYFDVAAQIPQASTVTGVTLTLHLDGAAQTETEPRNVALHRLLADWGEGTSGGGGPGGGQGQPPTTGDATWDYRFYDDQLWATPGGDFVAAASSVLEIGTTQGSYAWPSTTS
jgi:hypothetical protein